METHKHMSPFEKLGEYVPQDKIEELKKLVEIILAHGKPDMIILFGSYARGDFKPEYHKHQPKKSDFDILLIAGSEDEKEVLEGNVHGGLFKELRTPVQFFVETIARVNYKLEDQHFFYTDIITEGVKLHDNGKLQLSTKKTITPQRRREFAEEDFEGSYETAKGAFRTFIKAYQDVQNMAELKWCAFLLQQTVEHSYKTIEIVFSHYVSHEHYLRILREIAVKYDARADKPFPEETDEQVKLFQKIDFAYIAGRYSSKGAFPVTHEEIAYWKKEAVLLLEITEIVCKEKIEVLRRVEGKW